MAADIARQSLRSGHWVICNWGGYRNYSGNSAGSDKTGSFGKMCHVYPMYKGVNELANTTIQSQYVY